MIYLNQKLEFYVNNLCAKKDCFVLFTVWKVVSICKENEELLFWKKLRIHIKIPETCNETGQKLLSAKENLSGFLAKEVTF